MCFSITACVAPKDSKEPSNESSKEETSTVYPTSYYQVNETQWNTLFHECKCLDPFSNVTITAVNAGKVIFGNTDCNDIVVKINNGEVYADGYFDDYYIFDKDSYDEATGKYSLKMYQEDYSYEPFVWEFKGEGEALVSDVVGFFATTCFTTLDLNYSDFTFSEKENVYSCSRFTSKCAFLPSDQTYIIENMYIQFFEGQVVYFDYFVKNYNIKLKSIFSDRGSTVVNRPILPTE